MKSEHGAHGAMHDTAKLRSLHSDFPSYAGASHVLKPVRQHWWQLWLPKAPVVYQVGTMRSMADEYSQCSEWPPVETHSHGIPAGAGQRGTHHRRRGDYVATDWPNT